MKFTVIGPEFILPYGYVPLYKASEKCGWRERKKHFKKVKRLSFREILHNIIAHI